MWTLLNATKSGLTVGDLFFQRGQRHTVSSLDKSIMLAVNNGTLVSNPPLVSVGAIIDSSGGVASDEIDEITEAGNAGSADIGPTADAIATLTKAVNGLATAYGY